jgi:uncharacterized delta-60 repeat protein
MAVAMVAGLSLGAVAGGAATPAAGRADASFGRAGVVMTALPGGAGIRELLAQADGRFVAVGYARMSGAGAARRDVTLVRYRANGALDASFGRGGKVLVDVNGLDDTATAAALQRDGRIVVVGATDTVPATDGQDLLVLRIRRDGTPDPTFGRAGAALVDLSPATPDLDFGFGVAIGTDGSIVVAGMTVRPGKNKVSSVIARLLPDGRLDPTFGASGLAYPAVGLGLSAQAVLALPDGRVVVAGDGDNGSARAFVARLRRNGTLDGTFGTRGKTLLPRGLARALRSTDGGGLLVAGVASGTPTYAAVTKLDARGRLDRTFGTNGRATVRVADSYTASGAFAMAVQPDDKIVAAGGNADDILVLRLSAKGELDRAFGGTGAVTIGVGPGWREYASAVAIGRQGTVVAAGEAEPPRSDDRRFVVVALTGAGSGGTRYASIAAANAVSGVTIRWQTVAEPDVRGFVVYRSASSDDVSDPSLRRRLNAKELPGHGRASRYAFVDRTPPDWAPTYWLEEIRRDGTRALFGPIVPPDAPARR